ncbi:MULTISPECIES: metallophosphoesterase [unclassified Achromobacter]|uniref:metallophosphoesterase n=1 Tax=unclassified Achromobacter TaxID=2626865 RepID=UPI000B517572|nr:MULTISPECIES: metallophosphoesterase [unclassified Achromobacter]OWT76857.1 serine/threonine protein phosphatase [Achromobacter sp. HZ28]OWT77737.1 serine/threonine protein phosphatase [Achromobacter sp. HZ34]
MSPLIQHFARNTSGRDWAVGDIHGHFTRLRETLARAGFNSARDRLFSVGDLIDRGPECRAALEWLRQPWFHAVQGNHEDYAVRHVRHGQVDTQNWRENGGGWFLDMTDEDQRIHAEALARLPLALEVETREGLVGVVHADTPVREWHKFDALLRTRPKRARGICQWSRQRLEQHDATCVVGLRALVVGHTPVTRATVLGNVYHIDTGGWQPDGYFTLLDLSTLRAVPALPLPSAALA